MADDVNTNELGITISRLRREVGFSQEQLAKEAGVSQTTIDKIERGETKRSKFLPEIAKALKVPLKTIMEVPEAGAEAQVINNYSQTQKTTEIFRQKFSGFLPLFPTFDAFQKFRDNRESLSFLSPFIVGNLPIRMGEHPKMLNLSETSYSIYVTDESMQPEFAAGDIIIVDPSLPIVPNTSCVIYGEFEELECAMVARLLSFDEKLWILKKWAHPDPLPSNRSAWPKCHRIVARHIR